MCMENASRHKARKKHEFKTPVIRHVRAKAGCRYFKATRATRERKTYTRNAAVKLKLEGLFR